MPIEEAVKSAVDECIRQGILADFMRKNKAEAIAEIVELSLEEVQAIISGNESEEKKAK